MRTNRVAVLLGALLAVAAVPAAAASDPSLIYGECDAGRQDKQTFTACLEQETRRVAVLVERYAQAAKDSLRASVANATAQGWTHEARSYSEALEQFDVAQALWEQFREAHCTVQAKQITGSGSEAAPNRCRVRLTYDRLREISKLAPTDLPEPPTVDGRPAAPGPFASRWPVRDLARFVFEHLDLASFNNSTAPRRPQGQRTTLADLGIRPNHVSETEATSDDGQWLYSVHVLQKGDLNRDGVEEVLVCFRDVAQDGGSYRTAQPLVLQLFEGRVTALAYAQGERAAVTGCPRTDQALPARR